VAWLAAAAVGSLALAVVVSLVSLSMSRSAVVRANYDRVEAGMTREQVGSLLEDAECHGVGGFGHTGGSLEWLTWSCDDLRITAHFSNGVVSEKTIEPVPRTWLDRLKALWPF
jgi:hypothetical protein